MAVALTLPLPGISRERARAHGCFKGLVTRPGMDRHPEVAEVGGGGEGEATGDQLTEN